jgi:hypothetical protein
MPLTKQERQFLDGYVYEATNGPPFGGPATELLKRSGIRYSDLSWLLTAYQRELCAEGMVPSGTSNPHPPPSPWANLHEVIQRNRELKQELEAKAEGKKRLVEQAYGERFPVEEKEIV